MKELGFTDKIRNLIDDSNLKDFELGRVIAEHKERYTVQTESGIFNAEITGNLRFSANSRIDFPAVGDWVKITMMDQDTAIIMKILPRFSLLERQAVGKFGEIQLIATNIDYAFIVQSVGYDFNLKRIERYLTVCKSSEIEPIIILTKIDLIDTEELETLMKESINRIKDIPVFAISNITHKGFDQLESKMSPYKTYCFLGSSGVGKSSIINHLIGSEHLKTSTISKSTSKGRHTTSHRELIVLPNKSIVIDTPGMREIGITDQAKGIELTYDEITELAQNCKFNDCTHTNEKGCAVIAALKDGIISKDVYDNYLKLKREQIHFSSTLAEKRLKNKKQGKLFKAIKKEIKKNKF